MPCRAAALLGLACLAGAADAEPAVALLESTCFFQERAEVHSAMPDVLGDAPPLAPPVPHAAMPGRSVAAAAKMPNETGVVELAASGARQFLAADHMALPSNLLPGWSNGDDSERGIIRLSLDFSPRTMWFSSIFATEARAAPDGDEGWNFFKAAPVGSWVFLLCSCCVLCLLDCLVLARFPSTFKWHMVAVGVWVLAAVAFNIVVLVVEGKQSAFQWATGYLLEWMLSMDNLFVFHLVFSAYKTPADQIHKAAFVGILGAVIMRAVFFMVVSTLLNLFGWIRYPFGALLIYSGVEAARGDDDDDMDPKDTTLVKGLTRLLGSRLVEKYDPDGRMLTWSTDGRWQVTLLVVVIACLEFTDVLFALDSVSAKVAQIPDQYLAFSSTVLAMFGLRSMFFIIKDLVEMFELLKYGLCVILVFIGLNLILGQFIHLHAPVILCMIIAVFTICVVASAALKGAKARSRQNSGASETEEAAEAARPPRDPWNGNLQAGRVVG